MSTSLEPSKPRSPFGLRPDGALPTHALWQVSGRGRFLATTSLIFVVLFLRRPDALFNAQFWAEDAVVFFRDQILSHYWQVAFTTYAGYLHFIPRSIMSLACFLPTVSVPLFCNLVSLLLDAICCSIFVLPAYRYILESDLQRFLVCFLLASASFCDEMSANITNLQWYLTIAAVLMVFRKSDAGAPGGIFSAIAIGLAGAAIGCTSPLTVLLLPFLAWKLLRYRGKERIWLALTTAGVGLQAATLLGQHAAEGMGASINQVLFSTLVAFVYRVVLSTVAGFRAAVWISQRQLSGEVLLALVLVTVWLTWLYRASSAAVRRIILICLYLTFSSIAMAMVARRATVGGFSSLVAITGWRGERNFFLSACVLILLFALTVQTLWPRARSLMAAALLCAVCFGGLLANFRIPAYADFHWATQAELIDAWRKAWTTREPVHGIVAAINPGWVLPFPSRLASATRSSPWEGCLITFHGGPTYFVEAGHKRWVTDAGLLSTRGLKWPDDLVFIPEDDVAGIPRGEPIVH